MKIRLLSTVICAAMVSTMVMGCSSGASAPATTAAAAGASGAGIPSAGRIPEQHQPGRRMGRRTSRPQWSRREDKCGFRREKEAVD